MKRRQLGALLALAAAGAVGAAGVASAATASEVRKVAVVSLIGDELTIVRYRGETGSRTQPTVADTVANPDPVFDAHALRVATQALRRGHPTVMVDVLATPKPGSDTDPERLLVADKPAADNPAFVALRDGGYTHLLVIAKHRAPASLQLAHSRTGSGPLRGLGFYIDPALKVRRADTGERGQGFVAPYVHIRLSWIELAQPTLLADETVATGVVRSAARNAEGTDPWGAMSAEDKVAALRTLIQRGVAEAVPKLLAPR